MEMKIHYRKTSIIDEMRAAIATAKEPIDHFELTPAEFNEGFNHFDKSFQRDNSVQYMYRSIAIKVNNEQN